MTELKKVKVVTSGYIKQFYGVDEKFVHLEDYQRLRDEKHKLPEGYRVDEDGDLWTDEEVMPTALACMEDDGSLSFNFTHYDPSDSAALFVWLQRRAR